MKKKDNEKLCLEFSDEAKERLNFLIADIVALVNGYHPCGEAGMIGLLNEMLRVREEYSIGREGFTKSLRKDKAPVLTLVKGGR